jgi:hypothetical protein
MTSLTATQHHTCYWGNSGRGGAVMPLAGISKIHNEVLPKPQGRLRRLWSRQLGVLIPGDPDRVSLMLSTIP